MPGVLLPQDRLPVTADIQDAHLTVQVLDPRPCSFAGGPADRPGEVPQRSRGRHPGRRPRRAGPRIWLTWLPLPKCR